MPVELKKRLLTVDAYHALIDAGIFDEDDRIELLNGEIIDMSPVGDPHIGCIIWLSQELIPDLKGNAIVSIQSPISLDLHSEPEPDLTICRFGNHLYRNRKIQPQDIHLIIEVADSTLRIDREVKLPLYAAADIPIYWIVNLIDEQVEVYTLPDSIQKIYKQMSLYTRSDELEVPNFDLKLSVDELFG